MDTGSGRVWLSSCINERYGRWVYELSILKRHLTRVKYCLKPA